MRHPALPEAEIKFGESCLASFCFCNSRCCVSVMNLVCFWHLLSEAGPIRGFDTPFQSMNATLIWINTAITCCFFFYSRVSCFTFFSRVFSWQVNQLLLPFPLNWRPGSKLEFLLFSKLKAISKSSLRPNALLSSLCSPTENPSHLFRSQQAA